MLLVLFGGPSYSGVLEWVELAAKVGWPIPTAGEVLDALVLGGVTVPDDQVIVHDDGSVSVYAIDDATLAAAWFAFNPGGASADGLDAVQTVLSGVTDVAGLVAFLASYVVPAVAPVIEDPIA